MYGVCQNFITEICLEIIFFINRKRGINAIGLYKVKDPMTWNNYKGEIVYDNQDSIKDYSVVNLNE